MKEVWLVLDEDKYSSEVVAVLESKEEAIKFVEDDDLFEETFFCEIKEHGDAMFWMLTKGSHFHLYLQKYTCYETFEEYREIFVNKHK